MFHVKHSVFFSRSKAMFHVKHCLYHFMPRGKMFHVKQLQNPAQIIIIRSQ